MATPITTGLPPARPAAFARRSGFGDLGLGRRGRLLGLDLLGRLVLAQALEGGLAHHAVAGPAGELDLGHQLRLQPSARRGLLARRAVAGEGRSSSAASSFSRGSSRVDLVGAEAGADAADIDEMLAAVDADQQRAELPVRRRSSRRSPPHGRRGTWLWSSCRCGPSDRAHRAAWRRCLPATCGRPTAAPRRRRSRNARHSGSALRRRLPRRAGLQPRLALARAAARADPRRRRTAGRRRRRSDRRSCRPTAPPAAPRNPARHCASSAHDLAVDDAVAAGSAPALAIAANLSVQSRPLRVFSVDLAALDPQLHAIAVELDLVHPARARRRPLDRRRQSCGATKSGMDRGASWPAARRRGLGLLRSVLARASAALAARLRLPDRVGLGRRLRRA